MQKEKLIIYCDGGSRGNPGPAASAFVVTKNGEEVFSQSKYIGVDTNNQAEYLAVLLSVKWISEQLPITYNITINLDSQLVERQINGYYKVKNAKLKQTYDQIKYLINNYDLKINFIWNPREKNSLADNLVNSELDNQNKI